MVQPILSPTRSEVMPYIADRDTLELRSRILSKAQDDPEFRAYAKALAASDVILFINLFCYTYDSRREARPNHLPFILFPKQVDYVRWAEARLEAGQDGLIHKPRDMGVSWAHLARILWHWLFDPAYSARLGSQIAIKVDNLKSTDSLFGRLDYMLDHLPWWLLPDGYEKRKHRNEMSLVNPDSGNEISGEASTTDFGRSGRWSEIMLDEFAFWPYPDDVDGTTADSSPTRFFITTADKQGILLSYVEQDRFPTFRFNWWDHPLKTPAWAAYQKARRDPEDYALNVEGVLSGQREGLVYPTVKLIPRGSEFRYNGWWPLATGMDYGLDDETAIVWAANRPGTDRYRLVDCYAKRGRTIDFFVPILTGDPRVESRWGYGPRELAAVDRHADWPAASHYGDPAGKQRNPVTNTSVIQALAERGIMVTTSSKYNDLESRMSMTHEFLSRVDGFALPECQPLIDALENARFPSRTEREQSVQPIRKPKHDNTSHYRTAVEYLAVNDPHAGVRKRAERPKNYVEAQEW
jgi:hypothetical protein